MGKSFVKKSSNFLIKLILFAFTDCSVDLIVNECEFWKKFQSIRKVYVMLMYRKVQYRMFICYSTVHYSTSDD